MAYEYAVLKGNITEMKRINNLLIHKVRLDMNKNGELETVRFPTTMDTNRSFNELQELINKKR